MRQNAVKSWNCPIVLTNHGVDRVELRSKAGDLLLVLIRRLASKGHDGLDGLDQS